MSALSSPTSPAAARIFVSHSHADNAYCREFVRYLRDALGGEEDAVWYDEHNLGWGALRTVIDRELQARQHFIAILSPAACASEWVNAEIDAALYLLGKGTLRTLLFVTAARCDVSPLLQRYKRIERPDGSGYSAPEAAARVLPIVRPPARRTATTAAAATPEPAESPMPVLLPSVPPPVSPPPAPPIPPDQFPERLATLGFVPHTGNDPQTGKAVPFIVPPTVPVPAGPFRMGKVNPRDPEARYDGPARTVDLPAFATARYPVTVAEYACFVRAGQRQPSGWQDQLTHKLDHPVVSVSWHDAGAYAAWLARLSGQPWRLPTEEEWEKAARWDPRTGKSLTYPWGDTFDAARCNTYESKIGTTTPVGSYPAGDRARSGASPVGAEDLAGNVWEWTDSRYNNSTDNRVLRGGSWVDGHQGARTAYRDNGRPDVLGVADGFRLVVALARAGS